MLDRLMLVRRKLMKRLIVCCDGTWQSQENKVPTNVFKIAQAVKQMAQDGQGNNIHQILYYDQGIGAVPSKRGTQSLCKSIVDRLQKLGGGAFGWWIDEKIEEAYIFLCLNYEPGDEIYLLGFSRGAYTVRSLAGLISCSGLLQRPDISHTSEAYKIYRIPKKDKERRKEEANKFRQNNNTHKSVHIKFLGCWDTVGALGIPDIIPWLPIDKIFKGRYKFHDFKLSSIIENARHAIAIDEKTPGFDVAIMQSGAGFNGTLKQMWFPGNHGSVGGGTEETLGLSNAALKWMADETSQLGLDLKLADDTQAINSKTPFKSKSILNIIVREKERDIIKLNNELKNGFENELQNGFKFDLDNNFHVSVKERWCDPHMKYRPKNLQEFIKDELNNKPNNWCP